MTETKQEVALIPYREPTGGDSVKPFIPNDFASVYRFAELLAESGDMAPKDYKGNAPKIATAIFFGYEIGLPPLQALQSIAVINGKPSIYGDAALALVRASGQLEEFEERFEGGELYLKAPEFDNFGAITKAGTPNPDYKAVCRIKRKDRPAKEYEFSAMDAMLAGLYNKDGPWKQYKKRMLKMRSRSFGLRDEFTDVMRGMVLVEEAQDYDVAIEHSAREEPPEQEITVPAGRKPRKAKEAENKYQAGDEQTKVEEAEIIEEKKPEQADDGENPPADDKPKAAGKKAAPKAAPKEEPKVANPTIAAINFRNELFVEMDADKDLKKLGDTTDLKKYVTYINDLLMPLNTFDAMKAAWDGHDRMSNLVAAQQGYRNRMRDYHKARIENIGKDDEPPADGGRVKEERVFDYAGFLHELDVLLGAEKDPDEVNKIYAAATAGPISEKLVSDEQVENDLRPLLATHLERTDFGS